MTTIFSILLSSILALELRRNELFTVFIKSFSIGILHELFKLPSDVGFHFTIFIIKILISLITFGLQCHTLAFTSYPDSSQTQFIGL